MRFFTSVLLTSLFIFTNVSYSQPTCSSFFPDATSKTNPENQKACSDIRLQDRSDKKRRLDAYSANPSSTGRLFQDSLSPSEKKRRKAIAQKNFSDLKKEALSKLSTSPSSSWTRSAIQTLNNLSLEMNSTHPVCRDGMDNGIALHLYDKVVFCEQSLHMPPDAYASILSHEIAHKLDACRAIAEPLWQISRRAFDSIKALNPSIFSKCAKPKQAAKLAEVANDIIHKNDFLFNVGDPVLFDPSVEELKPLAMIVKQCGLGGPMATTSIATFPFKKAFSCSRLEGLNRNSEKPLSNYNRAWKKLSPYLKQRPTHLPTYNICNHEQQESYADILGAELLAAFIKNKQIKGTDIIGHKRSTACASWLPNQEINEYASPIRRLATVLQHPEIRHAVGCTGSVSKFTPLCPETAGSSSAKGRATQKANQ